MELIEKLKDWAKRLEYATLDWRLLVQAQKEIRGIALEIEIAHKEEVTWAELRKKQGGHSGED